MHAARTRLFCLMFCCSSFPADAWSNDGHHATGAIADELIGGTNAEQQVRELLNDETFEKYAIWTDCTKRYCVDRYDEVKAVRSSIPEPPSVPLHRYAHPRDPVFRGFNGTQCRRKLGRKIYRGTAINAGAPAAGVTCTPPCAKRYAVGVAVRMVP